MPSRATPARPLPSTKRSIPEVPSARDGRDRAMLEASRAVVSLFLQQRTSAFSVRELAAHAGLSERTFYRYFPRKEDAIRPYIDAGLERLISAVRTAPRTRSLQETLVEAHARIFREGGAADWDALLPVLNETESLRAVWLQVVTDAEAAFAHVVAEWLGLRPDSAQARLAGAVLAMAGRLALEQSQPHPGRRDPGEAFAEYLALLGPTLFEPPAHGPPPARRPPGPRGRQRRTRG